MNVCMYACMSDKGCPHCTVAVIEVLRARRVCCTRCHAVPDIPGIYPFPSIKLEQWSKIKNMIGKLE